MVVVFRLYFSMLKIYQLRYKVDNVKSMMYSVSRDIGGFESLLLPFDIRCFCGFG